MYSSSQEAHCSAISSAPCGCLVGTLDERIGVFDGLTIKRFPCTNKPGERLSETARATDSMDPRSMKAIVSFCSCRWMQRSAAPMRYGRKTASRSELSQVPVTQRMNAVVFAGSSSIPRAVVGSAEPIDQHTVPVVCACVSRSRVDVTGLRFF